jgi:hypothetical protein
VNSIRFRSSQRGHFRREFLVISTILVLLAASVMASRVDGDEPNRQEQKANPGPQATASEQKEKRISLFDGKSLDGWEITNFGGEGAVTVKDGQILLEMGNDLTGIHTRRKDIPKVNYEVTLEAMRVRGSDFFCGMTFPVKEGFLTLILGGWGGGLCGLSSIGGYDASENETSTNREFVSDKWYRIRLRVTGEQIDAWIDDENIISHTLDNRKLDTRLEVDQSKPFGFSTWRTAGALRKIELRELPAEGEKESTTKKP